MQKLLLFIWMMTTMTSVFSPKVYAISSSEQVKKVEVQNKDCDQDSDNDTGHKHVNLQIDRTVSSTMQVGFHADLSFEFELPLIVDIGSNAPRSAFKEFNNYFKVLFYYIISPNAP